MPRIEHNDYGEPSERDVEIHILDTQTGHKGIFPDGWGFSSWWWAIGNGSCDCNRELALYGGHVTSDGYCLGWKRYLIVSSDSTWYTLEELNYRYPAELKKQYLGAPSS